MRFSETLRRAGTALLVVIALALILGQLLGQPILLSYVETGSMQPTLDPGDGFVAVPAALAGPAEEGDVVTFQAEELHDGGLTTHRIVGETDRGYITRGDGNTFTDQDGSEPPVKETQIVAHALQINGQVVAIPHLGDVITGIGIALQTAQRTLASLLGTHALLGTQGLAYLLFGASLVYYIVGELRGGNERRRESHTRPSREDGLDPRLVVGALTALLVVGATLPMVVPAGTQEYGVVSAEFDSERPTVIPAGESDSLRSPVANGGLVPVVVYLEPASEGVDVRPHRTRLEAGELTNATVTLHAPDQTGYYRRFVAEHRYLAVLPPSAIDALYRIHPWAPIVAIDALIAVPFYVVGIALVGSGRIRDRSRNREFSVATRLRRAIRGLY